MDRYVSTMILPNVDFSFPVYFYLTQRKYTGAFYSVHYRSREQPFRLFALSPFNYYKAKT